MTRDEFIELLKENLEPNAQMDFLLTDRLSDDKSLVAFLDIKNVCMNADVDDPNNENCGGIVFRIGEELWYGH